jgi:hypothetical protein
MNAIRVIPFCSKVEEWPTWSERFLAKAKHCAFKDLLFGKLLIPKVDEEIDERSDIGNKKSIIIQLNEIAYTELILSMDVKTRRNKVAFNITRGCKTKDYPDGNGAIPWGGLKNKYEPVSAPSMVKLEKKFRELSLKKGQDPEIWITELEDLRVKLENMGSCITENQFMIHILNKLTSNYDVQLAWMERRVGDSDKPPIVEKVRGELYLRCERLNMKTSRNEEGEVLEDQTLFSRKFNVKCRNCGQVGHKSFQCKNRLNHNGGNNGNGTGANFCFYCRKPGHDKKSCFKPKKKEAQNGHASNFNGNADRRNYMSQDVVITATSKNEIITGDIWICDSGAYGYYCNQIKFYLVSKTLMRRSL